MNLSKKRALASKTFSVGKERIVFVPERLSEIQDAITKQDMRDLLARGAIHIAPIQGRKKHVPRTRRKGKGNIRQRVPNPKKVYMTLTRKLRAHVAQLVKSGNISKEQVTEARKRIRNKGFKSKNHLKEFIGGSQ